VTYFKVVLPKDSQVLLLEDSPMRIAWFKKRVPRLTVVSSMKEFQAYFDSNPICDYIFFDHDLGEGNGTGYDAVVYLKERFGGTAKAALIHTWNASGAKRMQKVLRAVYIPFGDFEVEVEN